MVCLWCHLKPGHQFRQHTPKVVQWLIPRLSWRKSWASTPIWELNPLGDSFPSICLIICFSSFPCWFKGNQFHYWTHVSDFFQGAKKQTPPNRFEGYPLVTVKSCSGTEVELEQSHGQRALGGRGSAAALGVVALQGTQFLWSVWRGKQKESHFFGGVPATL